MFLQRCGHGVITDQYDVEFSPVNVNTEVTKIEMTKKKFQPKNSIRKFRESIKTQHSKSSRLISSRNNNLAFHNCCFYLFCLSDR